MRDALVRIMARIEDIDHDLWEEGQEVGHPFWEALDDIHRMTTAALRPARIDGSKAEESVRSNHDDPLARRCGLHVSAGATNPNRTEWRDEKTRPGVRAVQPSDGEKGAL